LITPKPIARVVGAGFGVAVSIGSTVGIGILRLPATVAQAIPHPSGILAIWIFGGLYALAGTVQVIELGTMLPGGGGWYLYARRAFGDYAGIVVGLGSWLSLVAALAQILVSVGDYAGLLLPQLAGRASTVAVGALIIFGFVSRLGLRPASFVQSIASSLEGLALAAFIVLCFLLGHHPTRAATTNPIALPTKDALILWSSILIATQAVINTYDGWYAPFFFTEEDREPTNNLPRAMLIGTATVIVIYLLVNVALLYVLPVAVLARSTLPAADAGALVLGSASGKAITVISILILLSIVNALLLICSRIIRAMGRDGLLLRAFGRSNEQGTPTAGLYGTAGTAALLIASGTFDQLLTWSAALAVFAYLSGYLAVAAFRWRHPEWLRPVPAWGYPWTTAFAILVSVGFLIGIVMEDLSRAAYLSMLLFGGYILHRRLSRRASRLTPVPDENC
jgi:basic amino acid/polyamine antiporter, APA family